MAAIHQLMLGSAAADYRISRSLRFNSADNAYLSRTGGTSTSRRIHTFSFNVKRGKLGGLQVIASAGPDDNNREVVSFDSDKFAWQVKIGGSFYDVVATALDRDPNAHETYTVAVDTTQATASERVKLYKGLTQITSLSTANYPPQNSDLFFHDTAGSTSYIGALRGFVGTYNFDGLLSEFIFVDGQQLTPSSFVKTSVNNVPVPKKYSGTFGTNGFYLSFANNTSTTTIGYDDAGGAAGSGAGSNDWTATNFSVTAGAGNDSLVDTPTNYGTDTGAGGEVRGSYCTMNPLSNFAGFTLSNGNWDVATTANNNTVVSTLKIPDTGLFKIEIDVVSYASGGGSFLGITNRPSWNGFASAGNYLAIDTYGGSYTNGSTTDTNGLTGTNVSQNNDVWILNIDRTNGKFWAGRRRSGSTTWADGVTPAENGSGATTISLPSGDLYFFVARGGSFNETYSINFGQRPWADTSTPAFKALCTQNIPAGTITTSGSFTGNAAADGPVVQINGVPTALSINGNAVTFGTHADKLANGFKLRTASASYNASGSNTFSVTSTGAKFKYARAQSNP